MHAITKQLIGMLLYENIPFIVSYESNGYYIKFFPKRIKLKYRDGGKRVCLVFEKTIIDFTDTTADFLLERIKYYLQV